MAQVHSKALDLLWLEECLWVLSGKVDLSSYDFSLPDFFSCRRPWQRPERIQAVARFGVASNYHSLYQELAQDGIL